MTATAPVLRRPARRAAMLAVAAVLTVVLAACGSSGGATPELSGWVRDPLPQVGEVALPDAAHDDAAFPMRAPDGGLLLVYFGYTSCPDVCPTTMSDVQAAIAELGPDADRVEVALVTVDPNRDDAAKLTGYIEFFAGEHGHALRTDDPGQLKAAADAFGASYEVTVDEAGEVEVGHTAHLYAVDDQGRLLVTWAFGTSSEALATDVRTLLSTTPDERS